MCPHPDLAPLCSSAGGRVLIQGYFKHCHQDRVSSDCPFKSVRYRAEAHDVDTTGSGQVKPALGLCSHESRRSQQGEPFVPRRGEGARGDGALCGSFEVTGEAKLTARTALGRGSRRVTRSMSISSTWLKDCDEIRFNSLIHKPGTSRLFSFYVWCVVASSATTNDKRKCHWLAQEQRRIRLQISTRLYNVSDKNYASA
jgi:hypothetical protein